MTSKKLRDVKISEAFANSNDISNVIANLNSRLDYLSGQSINTFEEIVYVLQQIIEKFGGSRCDDIVFEVEITEKNIADKTNVVFFSQNPMLDGTISWGD